MTEAYATELQKKRDREALLQLELARHMVKRKSDERIEMTAYVYKREPSAAGDLRQIMQERVKLAREINFSLNSNDVFLLNALLNG